MILIIVIIPPLSFSPAPLIEMVPILKRVSQHPAAMLDASCLVDTSDDDDCHHRTHGPPTDMAAREGEQQYSDDGRLRTYRVGWGMEPP